MAMTLQFIVDCEPLKMLRVYIGTCFGHVMSKACQYATNDDKVLVDYFNEFERCLGWITNNHYMNKNQGKGGWGGKRHAWKVGYDFGS